MVVITYDSIFELSNNLLNFGFDHNIGFRIAMMPKDIPSCAFAEARYIIINRNVNDKSRLPFIIAHELGHVINGDDSQNVTTLFNSEQEHKANITGVHILIPYYLDYIDSIDINGLDTGQLNVIRIMNQLRLNYDLKEPIIEATKSYLIAN